MPAPARPLVRHDGKPILAPADSPCNGSAFFNAGADPRACLARARVSDLADVCLRARGGSGKDPR